MVWIVNESLSPGEEKWNEKNRPYRSNIAIFGKWEYTFSCKYCLGGSCRP